MFLETLDNETSSALFEPLANRLISAGALDGPTATVPTPETNHPNHAHQGGSLSHQTGIQELPCFNDLIAVLVECFALITIGYLSGRFKVISPEAKDLGAYLTTFALPMIIFLNVAQMEIKTINLSLLVCMLISKLLIFAFVSLITLAITYPTNFSYAGALSILTTQSNDFALGYPLFKSLYGKSKPEMLNYLNLMGPIQLLIINPLGIVMLEFGKSQLRRRMRREQTRTLGRQKPLCGHCLAGLHLCRAGSQREQLDEQDPVGRIEQSQREVAPSNGKSLMLVMPTNTVPNEQQVGTTSSADKIRSLLSQHSFNAQTEGQRSATPQVTEVDPVAIGLSRATSGQPPPPPPTAVASCCTCSAPSQADEEPIIDLGFLKALMTNPLIIMSLLALTVNLIHGPELPKFVTKVTSTIAASFAAPALLVVGLSMYGKFQLILSNPNDLLLASVLVVTKGMILPNVMRTVMQVTLPHYVEPQEIQSLVDFSYLYGLLPTAPGACIIAKQYEVLTNVVSLGMLLSTIVSAPLMLATSAVISKANSISPEAVVATMARVLTVSSSVTLVLSALTLYLLWKSNGRTAQVIAGALRDAATLKSRHLFTILLTITQLLVGLGGCLWLLVDLNKLKPHQPHPLAVFDREAAPLAGEEAAASTPSRHWPPSLAADYEDEDNFLDQDRRHQMTSSAMVLGILSAAGSSWPSTTSLACTTGFMHGSGGLLLARLLIACIVITNFTRNLRGHQMALQVSSLITRMFPLFVMAIVMCLVFESNHLTCRPDEPSLPRWPNALYFRLAFNGLFLLITISLFVTTFRLKNKAAHQMAESLAGGGGDRRLAPNAAGTLEKRQFVASNVSLVSGTSSEITTSTSIETNGIHGASSSHSAASRAIITAQGDSDTETNVMFDYRRFYVRKSESFRVPEGFTCQLRPPGDDGTSLEANQIQGHVCDMNNNNNSHNKPLDNFVIAQSSARVDGDDSLINRQSLVLGLAAPAEPQPVPSAESWSDGDVGFDRNSILVVFMLFQVMLSVTSIVQIIFQHGNSAGTFIVVELTNLIVDFGQGLLTFLVLGTKALSTLDSARPAATDQTRA